MSKSSLYYPNKMGKAMLAGMRETIGDNKLDVVLELLSLIDSTQDYMHLEQDRVLSFEKISLLQNAFEQTYGPYGGRGMMRRAGRESFTYGLKESNFSQRFIRIILKILPLNLRLLIGVRAFTYLFNKYTDQKMRVEKKEKIILCHIDRCPFCCERTTDMPICQFWVGLLAEFTCWLSYGRDFKVEEIACIACGDKTCTIAVAESPSHWPVV